MSANLRHSKVEYNDMRFIKNLKYKTRYLVMQIGLTNKDLEEDPDEDL